MISKDDIRAILSEHAGLGPPAELPDGAELVIDSFTLVVLQHGLEERHGLVIDPQFEDMALFTSIDGIHAYLTRVLAEG
ncbi:acyl carrier protein [Streptomyces actinomycinicus]|uniref:Acyl carrier protein n=1 Tax=Streptomyces actinomycinicus TaxID=1695166 RepID=A0A937ESI9_9ACTN|nr:acyl carrier protein [Streptomyces actinomycinicus]MBL1087675.1 acyl carrier protein [Streptomyces actinomycinicus]